jgi:hypothetical protein
MYGFIEKSIGLALYAEKICVKLWFAHLNKC